MIHRELFISNALSRHFAWSYNILFVEELLNNKACCSKFHPHLMLPTSTSEKSKLKADQHILRLSSLSEDKATSNVSEPSSEVVFSEELWKKHHTKHRDIEHTVSDSDREILCNPSDLIYSFKDHSCNK